MKLPQELVYIIISMLDEGSYALRNCSLVCHSWVHPSRCHLFRNVYFDLHPRAHHPRRLLLYPRMAAYVNTVMVCCSDYPLLPVVLDLLSNLTRIKLVIPEDWSLLPQDHQRSIYKALELPSVTSLRIEQPDGLNATALPLTCPPSTQQAQAHVVNKLLYTVGSSLRHFELSEPYCWCESLRM